MFGSLLESHNNHRAIVCVAAVQHRSKPGILMLLTRISNLRLGSLPTKWLLQPTLTGRRGLHDARGNGNTSLVDLFHREGLYRPVGTYIVEDLNGRCLVTRSVKVDVWSFPQGGIEAGESLEENMLRELAEEVGLQAQDLTGLVTGLVVGKVDFPPDRVERRGFSKVLDTKRAYTVLYSFCLFGSKR